MIKQITTKNKFGRILIWFQSLVTEIELHDITQAQKTKKLINNYVEDLASLEALIPKRSFNDRMKLIHFQNACHNFGNITNDSIKYKKKKSCYKLE